jgi:hypothetical protein
MSWDVSREDIMPRTWRCPAPVQELGESILRGCSDYWDRRRLGWNEATWLEQLCVEIKASCETHMLLGRSNFHAGRFA